MKLKYPMLVVSDMEKSVEFYKKVFGLHVIMDFGANKTLTGGLALQTLETYSEFIRTEDISFGGNNFEIYFEEDNFDKFIENIFIQEKEKAFRRNRVFWGKKIDDKYIKLFKFEQLVKKGKKVLTLGKKNDNK